MMVYVEARKQLMTLKYLDSNYNFKLKHYNRVQQSYILIYIISYVSVNDEKC